MNKAALSDSKALGLHSRYNPSGEAERYLEAIKLPEGLDFFILIEPGLGYLIPLLKKRHPGAVIVALHADPAFRTPSSETVRLGIPAWWPDSGLSVQQFLEEEIPDTEASSIRIIEWRPSLRVYGEDYLSIFSETVDFIKRSDANVRTGRNFGRRWLKNFFKNISLIRTALLFRPAALPVVITGSGPGLEDSFPLILEMREKAFILSSSSSLSALEARGLRPDLVISTDGGAWAPLHLFACVRDPAGGAAAGPHLLAINPCAAIPSQCAAFPLLVLNDGSLWQSLILRELGIPSLVIPQRGTVTASAVELALNLSAGNIYLAGMDLSVRDIRSHARPYGFDHLLYEKASRLNPVYSQAYTRSNNIRGGKSYEVYAAWFKSRIETLPNRIFPLGGNHPVFGNPKAEAALRRDAPAPVSRTEFQFREFPLKPGRAAIDLALGALDRAFEDPRFSGILRKELSPLLGGTDTANSVREDIRNLAAACGGNRRG
ncbi:MAG: DUF115 domain-containing protein [Treponema sp.]|jgi:hypothetical protein|nr:DUF115 domain-containing protein [Treponema sp.]